MFVITTVFTIYTQYNSIWIYIYKCSWYICFLIVVVDWKHGSIIHVLYCGTLYFYFIIIIISFTELQRFNVLFQNPQSGKTNRQLYQIKVYQEACKIILKNGLGENKSRSSQIDLVFEIAF